MPSSSHQLIVELLEKDHELVHLLMAPLPAEIRPSQGPLRLGERKMPERLVEYEADLVLVPEQGPILILEVQLRRDENKQWTWPLYVAQVQATHRRPAVLVVLTDSLSLARWAGEERQVGPSLRFRPMVMGPAQVPRVEDLQEAAAHPSRAVLSAVIHGRSHDGGPVAWAAMGALTGFDDATAARYADIIWSHLSKGARLFLEGLVSITPAYEIQSPFLRKLIATGEARGEARGERTAMECFIEERFPAELPDLSELLGACPDAELKSLMRQLFSARTPAEARQTLMRGRPH